MSVETQDNSARGRQIIQVADLSLVFHEVEIATGTPTGAELAGAAGFDPGNEVTVLEVLSNGALEDIRLHETVGLRDSTRRFVIVISDRAYKFEIDGDRYDWPSRVISGGQLRKLADVPENKEILLGLDRENERVIEDQDLLDLDAPGIEDFKTRRRKWKLNVQGVILVLENPTVMVRNAVEQAGFDSTKPWIIVLRVRGEAKREVALDCVIDLRTPGIEKLRLTPREVNNGEAPSAPRRMFKLLEVDERFLDGLGVTWETIVEAVEPDRSRRWLLIHRYEVPIGFTVEHVLLALEIPPTYPGAEIDMFYTSPPLKLKTGRPIPRTQVEAAIHGIAFNGWSRHRGPLSLWSPDSDNVATHLALVEAALTKETDG